MPRRLLPLAVLVLFVAAWLGAPPAAAADTAPATAPAAATTATPAPDAAGAPDAADAPPGCPGKKAARKQEKPIHERLLPIALLIVVIAFVVTRLPKVDLGHSTAFRRRRLLNWLPLGLTYSFLYMARYNVNQFMQAGGITEREFGDLFFWGSLTYGLSFFLNGPLADRWGGRATILISSAGSAVCNVLIGYLVYTGEGFLGSPLTTLTILYCANMYFQSFGAVSIVKVNAAWFHLRERGTFGGIFGILISLGLFLAYDVGQMINDAFPDDLQWLFLIPAGMLIVFFVLSLLFVRDNPSDAGFEDFDPGDATSHDDGQPTTVLAVMGRLFRNPIIMTVAVIELCSGFLRQAILQWGKIFGSGIGLGDSFVFANWGVVQCIAGIIGGMFAGAISDHLFQSRRLPVSAVLYLIMLGGAIVIVPLFSALWVVPWVIALMTMSIIGVHGMLSGTASADFGGKKNVGIAVGIIDGFVYFGSMIQSKVYGQALPPAKLACPDGTMVTNPAVKDIDNWTVWPYTMIPVALLGLVLAIVLWNARPQPRKRA
jgi:MFS transporter, OPA family, glycerol-3-phosphate transporter